MKKLKKCFILIFVLFFICDVKAASIYLDDEDGFSFSSLSDVTTHCDDDVCTDVTGNINSVMVANGYIMPIKVVFSKYDNENISEIKVTINSSSGISCSLTNLFDDVYDLNNNNFILKETMYDTEIDDFGGKDVGELKCSFPNTSSYIKVSSDNFLEVNLKGTVVSSSYSKEINETYKFNFGILNKDYYNSLANKTSIKSILINGKELEQFSFFKMNFENIDSNTLNLKITRNEIGTKNKITVTYEKEGEETSEVLAEEELSGNELNFDVPYGISYLSIDEETERSIIDDEILSVPDTFHFDKYGFSINYFNNSRTFTNSYAFKKEDNRSNVNTLKSLSISDVDISFKSELKNYMATVPYKVSSIKINSTLTDSKSSYVNGYGNRTVNLNVGTNNVLIKVKSEKGTEAIYTVKVTREENNDSSLKSLTVNNKEVVIKENVLKYNINVDNDVVKPIISAISNDSNAKVEIDNINELIIGDNNVNIIVTAKDGTKSNYVINIIRAKLISTNSKLEKIIIKNHELEFDKEIFDYNLKLEKEEKELNITVNTDDSKATYLITGNKNLTNGSIIKIKVTAEDGVSVSTYNIKIEKEVVNYKNIYIAIGSVLIGFIVLIWAIKKRKK